MADAAVQVTQMTEGQVDMMPKHFTTATESLKFASMALRTCYCNSGCSQMDFCKFRDGLRDLALIFKDGLYPVSLTVVGNLKSFMDYYLELDLDDWKEILPEIVTEAHEYAEVLNTVTRSYTCISSDFKSREDEVGKVEKKLELEMQSQKEREATRRLETENADWRADVIKVCTLGITDFNQRDLAEECRRQAIAANAEGQLCKLAIEQIRKQLIPAIANFVTAMTEIAGFFQVLTNDVNDFAKKGDHTLAMEEKKKQHFLILKGKAKRIQNSCDEFIRVAPNFVSDLQVVPMTDKPNFVQEWLAEQRRKEPQAPPLEDAWRSKSFKKLAQPMLKQIQEGTSVFTKGNLETFRNMIGF